MGASLCHAAGERVGGTTGHADGENKESRQAHML